MIQTIILFIIASIFEISGCYFVWQWFKNNKGAEFGILGVLLLAVYGILAALQTGSFAKVYVVYGGIFIIAALVWSYFFDKYIPDFFDFIGLIFIIIGIVFIYFVPRQIVGR